MVLQIVILGECSPHEDEKALNKVSRFILDNQPAEIVCFEESTALLEMLRDVYDGPIGVHGLSEPRFGATSLPTLHDIAPGWISTTRSDLGPVSRIPANTAVNVAKKLGVNAVMGTGRLGIGAFTAGHDGKIESRLFGMEVGHLADLNCHDVSHSQQGFGLFTLDCGRVIAETVPFGKPKYPGRGA